MIITAVTGIRSLLRKKISHAHLVHGGHTCLYLALLGTASGGRVAKDRLRGGLARGDVEAGASSALVEHVVGRVVVVARATRARGGRRVLEARVVLALLLARAPGSYM